MLKLKRWVALYAAVMTAASLCGCQANPEQDAVVNKNEGILESKISQSSETEAAVEIPSAYKDSFMNSKGDMKITVDAKIRTDSDQQPVVRVAPHEITGEEVKLWADVLFQGETAYEPQNVLTKTQIEQKILEYKAVISDYDALVSEYGSEEEADRIVDYYTSQIEGYEAMYASAPQQPELRECDWQFHPYEYYDAEAVMNEGNEDYEKLGKTYRLEAVTENLNGGTASISAYNRDEDDYMLHMMTFIYKEADDAQVNSDMSADDARVMADELVQKLNLNQWVFDSFYDYSEERSFYSFVYTPQYNSVQEILGPLGYETAQDSYSANYYYSRLTINITNGSVSCVELISPMDMVKVENENVGIKSFDDIYAIFTDVIQQGYTKNTILGIEEGVQDDNEVEIVVDEIALGLMRIKEKDNDKEFLLVPAWTFKGAIYINGEKFFDDSFATINAIDGSAINADMGY